MGRRRSSRRCNAPIAVLLFFLLVAAVFLSGARGVDGSRGVVVAGTWRRPGTGSGGGRLFGGYELPRAKIIPPSGPSERHNAVGPELESEQQQQHQVKKP